MKTFTIENETNNIVAHTTKREAAAVPNAESFSSDAELASLAANWPAPRLTEIWNGIPGNTPVRKFADRKTAATRIWKAIQSLWDSIPSEPKRNPKLPRTKQRTKRQPQNPHERKLLLT